MWEFYAKNIMRDGCIVATYYDERKMPLLDVYEGRNEYYTVPKHEFLKACVYSYLQAKIESDSITDSDSLDNALLKRLKYACQKFEADYKDQRAKILYILN